VFFRCGVVTVIFDIFYVVNNFFFLIFPELQLLFFNCITIYSDLYIYIQGRTSGKM